jgi:hypothetical protein
MAGVHPGQVRQGGRQAPRRQTDEAPLGESVGFAFAALALARLCVFGGIYGEPARSRALRALVCVSGCGVKGKGWMDIG